MIKTFVRRNRNDSGFTIVEVLTAMFVFAISVIAVTGLATSLQEAQRSNDYLSKAIQASNITIELFRNNFASNLTCGGTPLSLNDSLATSGLVNATGTLSVVCVDGVYALKRIDVKVNYTIGSLVKTVQTSTYIGNGGLYQ